jgi:hypothetical protein
LTHSSTLKVCAICSSETLVDFTGLHGVKSQKPELFAVTAVRSWVQVGSVASVVFNGGYMKTSESGLNGSL